MKKWKLDRADSALVVVDAQERLMQAMPLEQGRAALENMARLVRGAALLDVPVFVTEQYPKGLGPTQREIQDMLPPGVQPIEKLDFSCLGVASFREALERTEKGSLVICGVEAHVCVYQTALDALAAGINIFVAADAVSSRKGEHRDWALDTLRQAGAVVNSTEALLFEWLGRAEGDAFKEISRMVR